MRGTVPNPSNQAFLAPEANTDAVVTIAADSQEQWMIRCIDFSYSGTPTDGKLTITSGGVVVYSMHFASGGAFRREWEDGFQCGLGKAVVVTLAAGGDGVSGTLFVQHR